MKLDDLEKVQELKDKRNEIKSFIPTIKKYKTDYKGIDFNITLLENRENKYNLVIEIPEECQKNFVNFAESCVIEELEKIENELKELGVQL